MKAIANLRLLIALWLVVALAAWALMLLVRKTPVTLDHLWPFGLVLTLLVILVGFFEQSWWSWPLLQGRLVHRPDLRGTWRVELKSNWVNPDTGKNPASIICYVVIRQTLTSLSIRLLTEESSSSTLTSSVVREDDGVFTVAAVYRNEPRLDAEIRRRSNVHNGAMVVRVHGEPPKSLSADYWTDRNTTGTMTMTDRVPELYGRFQDAHQAFLP